MSFKNFYNEVITTHENYDSIIHPDQLFIDEDLDLHVDSILVDDIKQLLSDNTIFETFDDENEIYFLEGLAPVQKRAIVKSKKKAVNIATKNQFYRWPLKKRADFLAKFKFKQTPSGFDGMFVPREKPEPIIDIFKRLKKAARKMRRGLLIRKRIKAK